MPLRNRKLPDLLCSSLCCPPAALVVGREFLPKLLPASPSPAKPGFACWKILMSDHVESDGNSIVIRNDPNDEFTLNL
ncbi:hypothetical protein SLEP1_g26108 [Rubroshorea leprosula]|uniref:Secreted protein n=1 Tax=Rubroshorea leprosula TaxID=152421 RepID=A0AAV5JNY8_9ROSI|nr:hypothetical protein SLEP1_g26108 [Rubroshorea leprosula]